MVLSTVIVWTAASARNSWTLVSTFSFLYQYSKITLLPTSGCQNLPSVGPMNRMFPLDAVASHAAGPSTVPASVVLRTETLCMWRLLYRMCCESVTCRAYVISLRGTTTYQHVQTGWKRITTYFSLSFQLAFQFQESQNRSSVRHHSHKDRTREKDRDDLEPRTSSLVGRQFTSSSFVASNRYKL